MLHIFNECYYICNQGDGLHTTSNLTYKCTSLFAGALYCSGILPLRILSSVLRQFVQHIVPGR